LILRSSLIDPFPILHDWGFSTTAMFRPIINLSYSLDYLISHSPLVFFITNYLIHFLNSLLVFLIIIKLKKYYLSEKNEIKQNTLSNLIPFFIYFFFPQNFTNIFWISGRTDLICGLFLLLSTYNYIIYRTENKLLYLMMSVVYSLFALMSKETGLIIFFYCLLIEYLIYTKKKEKKIKYLLIPVCIIILYTFYRWLIFGANIYGTSKILITSMHDLLVFIFYGAFSLFIPFDLLDYYYLVHYNILLFSILSLFILVTIICVILLKILSGRKIFIQSLAVILISFLSLFVYYRSYPQMRLMTSHIPIFIIGLSVLYYNDKINWRRGLFYSGLFSYCFILLFGTLLSYKKAKTIDLNHKLVYECLPDHNTFNSGVNYLMLGDQGRISQCWAQTAVDNMSSYKLTGSYHDVFVKIYKCIYVESTAFSFYNNSINYRPAGTDKIIVTFPGEGDLFVPEPAFKFHKFNSPIYSDLNSIIVPLKEDKWRKGCATECLIDFSFVKEKENLKLIIKDGNQYKIISYYDFMNVIKNKLLIADK